MLAHEVLGQSLWIGYSEVTRCTPSAAGKEALESLFRGVKSLVGGCNIDDGKENQSRKKPCVLVKLRLEPRAGDDAFINEGKRDKWDLSGIGGQKDRVLVDEIPTG